MMEQENCSTNDSHRGQVADVDGLGESETFRLIKDNLLAFPYMEFGM